MNLIVVKTVAVASLQAVGGPATRLGIIICLIAVAADEVLSAPLVVGIFHSEPSAVSGNRTRSGVHTLHTRPPLQHRLQPSVAVPAS